MKPDSNCFDLNLPKNATLRLADAASARIVCRTGTVWITLDHDQRDIVLEAGDRLASTEHRHAMITALAPSALTLCATPDPAQSLHQRDRKGRGLVFEQVLV